MKGPPTNGSLLCAQSQAPNQNRRWSIKTHRACFDTFVSRYYPAVYNLASRLVDDPREAVLLTHNAFLSVRKHAWRPHDEMVLVRLLLKAAAPGPILRSLELSAHRRHAS